jgi:hypothetical protein
MQPDLLQQLRDIHLPPEPAWWPPAAGWWLLGIVLLVGLIKLVRVLRQTNARRKPIRQARRIYAQLHADYEKGLLSGPDFLHQCNELLKRLLIHGLGQARARPLNDSQWLELLDECGGTRDFTEGPGRQLGNQRFRPFPEADPESLHPVVAKFLQGVRP